MTLLQAAESLLGPINPWPSNIVNYLFIETPTFWSTIALIAFLWERHSLPYGCTTVSSL